MGGILLGMTSRGLRAQSSGESVYGGLGSCVSKTSTLVEP